MEVPPRKENQSSRYYADQDFDEESGEEKELETEEDEEEQPQWPQSYRQSIDAYSYLTPPVSRSFLSGSLKGSLYKPEADEQQEPKLPLLPDSQPTPVPLQAKPSVVTLVHGFPEEPQDESCSSAQAILNGVNVLAGVGILSTPYAIKQGGWIGLVLLFFLGVICWYTGVMLRKCLESKPGLQTYPDIGQAAFGNTGRLIISIVLYVELYACCVEFLILEGDNLSSLFPMGSISVCGWQIGANKLFIILAALCILPTVWLRNLKLLSYVSAGGVIASVVVVLTVFWVGTVDGVGFHQTGKFINLSGMPVSIGLYGFCYSGHAVFPNIYTSMRSKRNYNRVLTISFVLCAGIFGVVAVMGYSMFGDATQSQITLNMPKEFVASKIALWTIIINPLTKYALTITPVALSLEELLPCSASPFQQHAASIAIRTFLVGSTVLVAVSVPFFGLVMAFIGSFLSMAVSLIMPCACYIRIWGAKLSAMEVIVSACIMLVGTVCAVGGTFSSLDAIIQTMNN